MAAIAPALVAADEGGSDLSKTRTYHQTNLVSDLSSLGAVVTDQCLVNPRGITYTTTGSPFWISDNNAGVSTLYNVVGQTGVSLNSRVVTIPPTPATSDCRTGPIGTPTGAPTGAVFNASPNASDFVLSAGGKSFKASFIFATEDGTIAGWSSSFFPPMANPTAALIAVDNSKNPSAANGAVYKGLALASSGGKYFLYATNFRPGTVDVFDSAFKPATSVESSASPTRTSPKATRRSASSRYS
jgi:uncharacterized protein (TIGR03118 family)